MNVRVITIIFVALFTFSVEPAQAATLQDRAAARRAARLAKREPATNVRTSIRERALARRMQRRENQKIRLQLVDQLGEKDRLRQQVVRLVNAERSKEGLPALQYNTVLESSAQVHAEDMLQHGYFSHYSRGGESYVDRMKSSGFGDFHAAPCSGCRVQTTYGENIAKGQHTAKDVVQDWMDSPPHKKNILSKEFDSIGIVIAGVYWVQNFGAITVEKLGE